MAFFLTGTVILFNLVDMAVAITLEVDDDLKIRRMLAVGLDVPAIKFLLFGRVRRNDGFLSLGFGLSGLVDAT